MAFTKNVFVQIEIFNWKNFFLALELSKKLGNGLSLILIKFSEEEKNKILDEIREKGIDINFSSFDDFGEARTFLDEFKPDLVILTQQKLNPFKHIFFLTDAEKFIKGLNDFNTLLLWEDAEKIEKILINVDLETSTEKYVELAFQFASSITENYDFVYSFYESFYEYRLSKTHATEEAKQLVAQMFEEHVDRIKNLIAKTLKGKEVSLKVIKGDPKKEVPYYLRKNNYDLLLINQSIEDKESYVENTENSVGILLD